MKANWNPITFDEWVDPQNNKWLPSSGHVSYNVVAAAILESYLDSDLIRASSHHNGLGSQEGVDVGNTLRNIIDYEENKKPDDYHTKCTLESIISHPFGLLTEFTTPTP